MDKEIGLERWQGRGEGTKALYVLPRAELPGLVMVNIHPVTWWKHKAEEFCSND